jgi:prepilin-type N-terminal cleavage/methylation domain-containing protein
MRVPRSRRGERADGFSLLEMVVTIGLIATVAVLVIPTVVRQASSAELPSIHPRAAAYIAR